MTNPGNENDFKALEKHNAELRQALADQSSVLHELRGSEAKYALLFNTVLDPILLCDLQTQQILDANEGAMRIYGYSHVEFLGMHLKDIMGDSGSIVDDLSRIGSRHGSEPVVRYHRKKDKSLFPVEISISRIYLDDRECACLVLRDITKRMKALDDLRSEHALLRCLLDSIPEIIFMKDHSGRYLGCNKLFEDLYSVREAQIVGHRDEEVLNPIIAEDMVQKDEQALARRASSRTEEWVVYPDGKCILLETLRTPYHSIECRSLGLIGIGRDITDRHAAEHDLRESEAAYKAIFENTGTATIIIENDTTISLANTEFANLAGMKKEDIENKKCWTEFFDPNIAKKMKEYHDLRRIDPQAAPRNYESIFINASGEKRNIYITVSIIPGSLKSMASFMDITDRKKAEEALRENQRSVSSLMSNLPGMVYRCLMDDNWTMEFVSEGCKDLTGFGSDDLLLNKKISYAGLIHPADRAMVHDSVVVAVRDNRPFRIVYRIITADSHEKWVWEQGHSVHSADGAVEFLEGFITDITERKNLEDQLRQAQKMEAIGTIAGGIAHDFNNILGAIILNTEMAREDTASDNPVQVYLDQILEASERARNLVRQILTFSRRSEEGKTPVIISLIVKEVLKLLRALLPSTIEIRHYIQAETQMVLADPTQIHQVIINLCTNAGHAMREKGGVLEVSLKEVEIGESEASGLAGLETGKYLELTVSDTGTGMPQEIMERVFEPFFTTKAPGEGTGMGLAVVHGIVENFGGNITVRSEVGKGTTFRILLPLLAGDAEENVARQEPVMGGDESIMFVDDEESIARVGQKTLQALGYRVRGFTRSVEAYETIAADPAAFDLVITDQTMPEMTGMELAAKILQLRPGLPVILCTGYSQQTSADMASELGISRFLMKPVNTREMAMAIRELLDR